MSSFNTQPPEGGCLFRCKLNTLSFSFNTQPPEGGCMWSTNHGYKGMVFQHTAARRWLRFGC